MTHEAGPSTPGHPQHDGTSAELIFAGPGEARARCRAIDWSATPLGPTAEWTQSLKTAVDVCLGMRFPAALLWGPELVMIHNDAHIPILGARYPAAMGRPAREVLRDTWPRLGPLVANALASPEGAGADDASEPVDLTVTLDRGDDPRQAQLTVSIGAVHDESGCAAGVMITAVDMTPRMDAESALRASEARYRALASASADVVYWMSPDWTEMRQLDGRGVLSETAVPSRSWLERYIRPNDQTRVTMAIEAAVREKRTFELEYPTVRRDGTLGWTFSRAVPMLDEHGEIIEWIGAVTDINAQRTARDIVDRLVTERTAERDALRRRLLDAEEAERRRLSRELHDHLGQQVTALGLELQLAVDVAPPRSEVDRRLAALRGTVDRLGRELHHVAVQLRPRALDDFGLEPALASYVDEWSRRTGTRAVFHARMDGHRMPNDVETTMYRVVQEALTNIAKHAEASQVSVVVEKREGEARLIVEDDGRGFDVDDANARANTERRLGLASMRERAELVGGTMTVESSPGNGATVFVRVPLRQ